MGGAPGVRLDGGAIFYTGQRETVYAGYSGVDRSFFGGPNPGLTFTGCGNFGGGGGGTTGQQNPQRPEKKPNFVMVAKKGYLSYEDCVQSQWQDFNRNVEKVMQIAEKHFEENELPWPIKLLEGIAGGIGGGTPEDPAKSAEDKLKDAMPDIINLLAKNKEIEDGTQHAAEERDKAIEKNCKKP
jgi:hypothetical protein